MQVAPGESVAARRELPAQPYGALAAIYDEVMGHVNYAKWVDFTREILSAHGLPQPSALRPPLILECACGTGIVALMLASLGYRIEAFDASPAMVKRAREKAVGICNQPDFRVGDFLVLDAKNQYDAAICLYDSINYLMSTDQVSAFLKLLKEALKPGGLFLFDICTELNSQLHFADNSEDGSGEGFSYHREMRYDHKAMLQENRFWITFDQNRNTVYTETHRQRIYPVTLVRQLIHSSGLTLLEEADEFTRRAPHADSLRVHFLSRA